MHNRPYDIIVFGATGFTGKLVVEYLIEHYGVNNELFTETINKIDGSNIEETAEANVSFFEEDIAGKNGFTKEELEILNKPFDDPLFELYSGRYIDAFEYILNTREWTIT